jgi:hypothetical protein
LIVEVQSMNEQNSNAENVVLYRSIRTNIVTTRRAIRDAQRRGFTLVRFEGLTDADLGMPGNRGPRWAESKANMAKIQAVLDAVPSISAIDQCAESISAGIMEDEEAEALVRANMGASDYDL